MEAETIQPHLRVFERIEDCRPGKGLITSRVIVILQAELYVFSLLVRQELGRCRIIVDPEVCNDRYNNGQKSFLYQTRVSVNDLSST